ncbi:MAG TPA: hypothetical protein DCX07_10990 [Phycisphaerales bacterium]|nr:hypothetical protein [Phycisphaerales bacterium]
MVFLVAIAVVATAMAVKGWQIASFLLAGVIVLIGLLLVMQVYRAVQALRRKAESVRDSARKAEHHYVDVLRRIVHFVEARDSRSAGHSERVGKLSGQIARKLGLDEARCEMISLIGELYDIGLLAISEKILYTPARIGITEYREVQKHCRMGYEILQPLEMFQEVLPAVLYHHERMNGTGYPEGLQGGEIPLESRILAVADSYEAMTHDRPHRAALTPLAAMNELRRCTPAGYDPKCVEALAEIIHLPALERVACLGRTAVA